MNISPSFSPNDFCSNNFPSPNCLVDHPKGTVSNLFEKVKVVEVFFCMYAMKLVYMNIMNYTLKQAHLQFFVVGNHYHAQNVLLSIRCAGHCIFRLIACWLHIQADCWLEHLISLLHHNCNEREYNWVCAICELTYLLQEHLT